MTGSPLSGPVPGSENVVPPAGCPLTPMPMTALPLPVPRDLDRPPLDVLAVFAHPDDAELICGGALAAGVDAGQQVGILDLTRGETGSRGTPEIRAREAMDAAEILGVEGRWTSGLPDGALEDSPEARIHLARHLRILRPGLVVTHWRTSRHPDHRAASTLVDSASFMAGLKNLPVEDAPPYRPRTVARATLFRDDAPAPDVIVDVGSVLDRRTAAVAAFRSQFEGAPAAGEVRGGGPERPLEEQVRHHLAREGSRIGVAWGEPYVTEHPLAIPHLGALDVPTY
ncbi:MAG: bacillithiol biosynthesis deacetylase BshB1 [Gemmatimonadales bacterium]|nr:MAG: bacillithiol biosynthesis deacetylase BshB1 [Gemmatimonadales bacterium]